MARRGKCQVIWSDNAKNFVGARNELNKMFQIFSSSDQFEKINQFCILEQIQWKFIPPRSPNFGGLWESSIKSFKGHFKKVASNINFSYEELLTIIVQIEGILNSRPLYSVSEDPNDPQPITPSHFLIGGPITSTLEPSLVEIPTNRLSKWKRLTQIVEHFWRRYSREYLHNLQTRTRWKSPEFNLLKNDLVLLVDDQTPSFHWLMGRILEVKPGHDGKVRVATVRTRNGVFSRSISKLCKLPIG